MKKRKPIKGYLYLASSDDYLYKYGCTRGHPKNRMRHIKHKTGHTFKILHIYESDDMFGEESNVKWMVLNNPKIDVVAGTVEFFRTKDIDVETLIKIIEECRYDSLWLYKSAS